MADRLLNVYNFYVYNTVNKMKYPIINSVREAVSDLWMQMQIDQYNILVNKAIKWFLFLKKMYKETVENVGSMQVWLQILHFLKLHLRRVIIQMNTRCSSIYNA